MLFRRTAGIALCALILFVHTAPPLDGGSRETDGNELRILARKVHSNINAERESRGLNPLQWSEKLAGEARRHAANMAHRHFFSHIDPARGGLASRLDESGIEWQRCSENIYREKGIKNPAADVVKSWLNSPGHRKNMLDLWMVESGVGAAMRDDGVLVIVQAYVYQQPGSRTFR